MSNTISIAEAARVADVSAQTIRNWIRAGRLTAHKTRSTGARGRTFLKAVSLDELREVMKAGEV